MPALVDIPVDDDHVVGEVLTESRVSQNFFALGLGMVLLFATSGAPDLALTQILVETVTLVAFALVLRRIPSRMGEHNAEVLQEWLGLSDEEIQRLSAAGAIAG